MRPIVTALWWFTVNMFAACAGQATPADAADPQATGQAAQRGPVRVIFDTDMGNDVDDALALAMLHGLAGRGECEILAVTVSKDNVYAPMYVDVVNTFYGRGGIPIGVVVDGKTKHDGDYTRPVVTAQAGRQPLYPRTAGPDAYPRAVRVLRRVLAAQRDGTVVVVIVGFSTNMARLLDSAADDVSALAGRDLFARKVARVVMMAGDFSDEALNHPTHKHREYNVRMDIPSAKSFVTACPSPIVFCGFELGPVLAYPGSSSLDRFNWAGHHPVSDAYRSYDTMPYDRPSWDLTAVLEAVRPDSGLFGLSEPGVVKVLDDGLVAFLSEPDGPHRYLTLIEARKRDVIDTMVELATRGR